MSAPSPSARGFTLVETLVTVGILIFLVGMTVTAGTALAHRSEVMQTETTLRLLDMAVLEWEQTADRKLTWGAIGHADIFEERTPDLIITEMLTVIMRSPGSRDIVTQINPDFIYAYDHDHYPPWLGPDAYGDFVEFEDEITVLDAWGTPIYATHPGSPLRHGDPGTPDADGTIRTWNETLWGVARHRRVCFVSAGPDRAWGSMSAATSTSPYEETIDNIFSYEVERPEAP